MVITVTFCHPLRKSIGWHAGNYVVVFDPLDGSSNLDAGISTGSIFGIYEPSEECNIADMDDPEKMMKNCVMNVCQPGNALLAAGYCLYSSSIHFVLTIGKGVWGFTYDSLVGEFVLTHPDLKVRVRFSSALFAAEWGGVAGLSPNALFLGCNRGQCKNHCNLHFCMIMIVRLR